MEQFQKRQELNGTEHRDEEGKGQETRPKSGCSLNPGCWMLDTGCRTPDLQPPISTHEQEKNEPGEQNRFRAAGEHLEHPSQCSPEELSSPTAQGFQREPKHPGNPA